ncbi:hypothetical protein ACN6LA_007126 [Streptomyces sp. SAS_269]
MKRQPGEGVDGPRDFFDNPVVSDPAYIIRLALEGAFNGIAVRRR